MKKKIIILAIFSLASLVWGAQEIMTHDKADSYGKPRHSGIPVTNSQIGTTNLSWTTNSLGAASAMKVVALDSNGWIHPSMLPVGSQVTTNVNGYTYSSGAGYTWSTVFSLTTTASNGLVCVQGQAIIGPSQAHLVILRVRDTANTVAGNTGGTAVSGANGTPYSAVLYDLLTGTPKTYVMEVATSSTATTFTNVLAGSAGSFVALSNGLNLTITQFQPK